MLTLSISPILINSPIAIHRSYLFLTVVTSDESDCIKTEAAQRRTLYFENLLCHVRAAIQAQMQSQIYDDSGFFNMTHEKADFQTVSLTWSG